LTPAELRAVFLVQHQRPVHWSLVAKLLLELDATKRQLLACQESKGIAGAQAHQGEDDA